MRSLLATIVLLTAGCAPPPSFEPLSAGACGVQSSPQASVALAWTGSSPRLGACGELSWVDQEGDAWIMGPDLAEPVRVGSEVTGLDVSPLGDQLLMRIPAGTRWLNVAQPDTGVTLATGPSGFVRDGARSIAWVCAGGALSLVEPSGDLVEVAEAADLCRVWSAPDAPVLAFIDADQGLAVFDLRDGRVSALPEVPFIAASNDDVRLSRDGHVLFHHPSRSPVSRIGVFDLRRSAGERFIGAPEVRNSLGGIVEAPGGGHTAVFRGPEGFYAVTPGGFLNHYEGATLFGLSPDGERLLMVGEGTDAEARLPLLRSDLDAATLDEVGTVPAAPNQLMVSSSGQFVLGVGRTLTSGSRSALMQYDWSTETYLESVVPTGQASLYWLSDGGESLRQRGERGLQLGALGQGARHEWPDAGSASAWSLEGGEVLVRSRGVEGGQQLMIVGAAPGASRVLLEEAGLRSVMVDLARQRLAYLFDTVNEEDPTVVDSTLVVGAMP